MSDERTFFEQLKKAAENAGSDVIAYHFDEVDDSETVDLEKSTPGIYEKYGPYWLGEKS